ncbi:MAG: undecaprenyl-diphosphate phosphatase, partial [Calditrichaeota bacterium]|nr:undecaprenyl-diphosphate phosphatase [Calditrichota bacterium]
FTGAVMWSSRYTQEDSKFFNLATAILIGCAQAFAIIPGISRSGSTIVMALWLGVKRETAARFSFLLSIPVILGATILQVKDFMEAPPPSDQMMNIAFATIAAAISGYFAIILLLDIIRKQKLEWFGVYCVTVALIGIVYVNFF